MQASGSSINCRLAAKEHACRDCVDIRSFIAPFDERKLFTDRASDVEYFRCSRRVLAAAGKSIWRSSTGDAAREGGRGARAAVYGAELLAFRASVLV